MPPRVRRKSAKVKARRRRRNRLVIDRDTEEVKFFDVSIKLDRGKVRPLIIVDPGFEP